MAQSGGSSTTGLIVPDLNGNRVEAALYTAKDGDRQELTQSINGRRVPLQNILPDLRLYSDKVVRL